MWSHRITMTYFRTCSTRRCRSQAPLCHYTPRLVSNQAEGTFARLRYNLGGDRPSQTAHQTLSPLRVSGEVVMPFVQVGTYPTRNFATLGPFIFVAQRCCSLRCSHFCCTLHVAMQIGLYHPPCGGLAYSL